MRTAKTGRTYCFVDFVMRRLIYRLQSTPATCGSKRKEGLNKIGQIQYTLIKVLTENRDNQNARMGRQTIATGFNMCNEVPILDSFPVKLHVELNGSRDVIQLQ